MLPASDFPPNQNAREMPDGKRPDEDSGAHLKPSDDLHGGDWRRIE
jgi:hypothetical protein